MLIIEELDEVRDVYDIQTKDNHNFYANSILVHNCEILQPTTPLHSPTDENGRIGICILSSINLVETKPEEIPAVCHTIVRLLNNLIDYQLYPFEAARLFCQRKRSIGVGITNFAAWLASRGLNHESIESIKESNDLMEMVQYHLLDASCSYAEEFGKAADFDASKYSLGWLPCDSHSELPEDVQFPLTMDWEALRERIRTFGLANDTLSTIMPGESSSVNHSSTNSIEAIRAYLTEKIAKNGVKKVLTPNYPKHKKHYTIAWDMKTNLNSIKIASALQKWVDMSISFNTYLNYQHYPEGKIPISVVVQDILTSNKYGLRTMYYNNTPNDNEEMEIKGCESGACSL